MPRSIILTLTLAVLIPFASGSACRRVRDVNPGKQTPEELKQFKAEAAAMNPMVRIEGGCFKMGTDNPPDSPPGMGDADDKLCVIGRDKAVECYGVYEDEMPAHEVCVDPFEIDVHEVTFGAYQLCAETLICKPSDLASSEIFWGPNRPAVGVEWPSAKAFCEFIGRRLPTEAEWEFAARGTDGRTYPWGEQQPQCGQIAMRLGDEKDACGRYGTKNVDLPEYDMDTSPFGLADMGGNVREWVSDYYHPGYYFTMRDVKTTNPAGPEDAVKVVVNMGEGPDAEVIALAEAQRVVRGGTWLYAEPITAFRTTNRRGVDEVTRTNGELMSIGFRCARSIEPPPAP